MTPLEKLTIVGLSLALLVISYLIPHTIDGLHVTSHKPEEKGVVTNAACGKDSLLQPDIFMGQKCYKAKIESYGWPGIVNFVARPIDGPQFEPVSQGYFGNNLVIRYRLDQPRLTIYLDKSSESFAWIVFLLVPNWIFWLIISYLLVLFRKRVLKRQLG